MNAAAAAAADAAVAAAAVAAALLPHLHHPLNHLQVCSIQSSAP